MYLHTTPVNLAECVASGMTNTRAHSLTRVRTDRATLFQVNGPLQTCWIWYGA